MSTPSPQTRRAPARQRAGVDPATPSLRDVAPVTHLFRFVPGPVRLRGTARRLALVAALASLVTGGLATAAAPALAAAAAPPTVRHQPMIRVVPQAPTRTLNGEVLTYNWSGYALDEGTYTGVSACWDVPAVPVTPLDTYSSAWVGIGGFSGGDTTLIQTGTTEESYQGQVYYFAWTELLPAEPALLFAVTPGDTVCASIAEQSANVWGIAIQDKTGGGSYSSTTIDYTSSESSAEWIMERPELCTGPLPADCTLSTLADYGELTFTAATVNGGNPELTSADGIFMYSDADQLISTPSTPNSSGNGFNVAYGPVAPLAPLGQAGTAGAYTPLKPFRLCDTRSAASVGYTTECTAHGALAAGSTMTFAVTGQVVNSESVPDGAQAVVVNLTAIDGSASTFLTMFPAGSAVPTASNLNVGPGNNEANLVVVALGTGGELSLYNSQGSIDVAVDVEGYFAAPTGASGTFHPIAPLRLCDTRSGMDTACSGTPLTAGAWQKVVVSGCPEGDPGCSESVPSDGTAEAVALNLTAVDGSSGTYLSVVPPNGSDACPTTTPSFSNLNVGAAHNLPNRVIVPLGPDQDVCVYNSLGTINYILDINGWFGDGSESTPGALFYAVSPLRLCDSRGAADVDYATECSGETLTQGDTLTIPVAGVDGLPTAAGANPPVAVIANVTAVNGTAGTLFTLYPAGIALPLASDLNINASQNIPNLVIVQLSSSGAVDLFNDLGTINAVVDVAGWFQDPA
jgi:hypothetical protein